MKQLRAEKLTCFSQLYQLASQEQSPLPTVPAPLRMPLSSLHSSRSSHNGSSFPLIICVRASIINWLWPLGNMTITILSPHLAPASPSPISISSCKVSACTGQPGHNISRHQGYFIIK